MKDSYFHNFNFRNHVLDYKERTLKCFSDLELKKLGNFKNIHLTCYPMDSSKE